MARLVEHDGVVVLGAVHVGGGKTRSELDTLHGRDAKEQFGNHVLDAVKHGGSHTCREANASAFDNTAHRVLRCPGAADGGLHGKPRLVVEHGETLAHKGGELVGAAADRIERHVLNAGDRANMGSDANASASKNLQSDTAGRTQAGRETPRKVAATRHVLLPMPARLGREVGVARSGVARDLGIVRRARVGVLDDHGKRRATCAPLGVEAAQHGRCVGLLARGRPGVLAGSTSRHERRELFEVDGLTRRQAIDDDADGRRMRLAKNLHLDA